MSKQSLHKLPSPDATAELAQKIGAHLNIGDVVLLEGDIGAGKTHFARSLIQSIQVIPEDVPSPTFTLVQEYDTVQGPLWHSDLYRLTHVNEIIELGLEEAFETAICLIEWPDRLADMTPTHALTLKLANGDDVEESRQARFSWTAPRWDTLMDSLDP